jgi:hypothetical protein
MWVQSFEKKAKVRGVKSVIIIMNVWGLKLQSVIMKVWGL